MKYTEFRESIFKELKSAPGGMTWREIREALDLPYSRPCPQWVERLGKEIGLERRGRRGASFVWTIPGDSLCDTLCSVTPTLCALFGTPPSDKVTAAVSGEVVAEAMRVFNGGSLRKCLVFAPDALGCHLTARHPGIFDPVSSLAPLKISLVSMVPPKTPVCFASMFTGLLPDQHGIQCYEKPVLTCGTLFDALAGAGIRVAIVAVEDSSIDVIFRGREIDYYSEKYDAQVTQRVLWLLQGDRYDFILAYHQEYDDVMHRSEPFSQKAMEAVEHHIDGFSVISEAVERNWGPFNRALVFAPDHGAHLDLNTGRGTHGDDIPEDMEVCHYWGFRSGDNAGLKAGENDTQ